MSLRSQVTRRISLIFCITVYPSLSHSSFGKQGRMASIDSLPKTHRALVVNSRSEPIVVEEARPLPQLTSGSAIVRVLAVHLISYAGEIYVSFPRAQRRLSSSPSNVLTIQSRMGSALIHFPLPWYRAAQALHALQQLGLMLPPWPLVN